MMWTMKYIMILLHPGGPSPILFPGSLKHVHVAHDFGFPVRSAGWVQIEEGRVITYGDAKSLDKVPHQEDDMIIMRHLVEDSGS